MQSSTLACWLADFITCFIIDRLIGDVLMLTGFLSYAGPFNQEFRSKLLKNWKKELADRKVPYSADLHITNTLVDQPTIVEWNLQGLSVVTVALNYQLLFVKIWFFTFSKCLLCQLHQISVRVSWCTDLEEITMTYQVYLMMNCPLLF